MRPPITADCPVCGQAFSHCGKYGRRKALRESMRRHLTNVHHTSDAEARRMVDELNLGSEGTPLEQAIREWDELVKAGVIKEVPR